MKFFCDDCGAQYFIADEKIGSRGVKVRCKRCENIIIVAPPPKGEEPPAREAGPPAPPVEDAPEPPRWQEQEQEDLLAGLGADLPDLSTGDDEADKTLLAEENEDREDEEERHEERQISQDAAASPLDQAPEDQPTVNVTLDELAAMADRELTEGGEASDPDAEETLHERLDADTPSEDTEDRFEPQSLSETMSEDEGSEDSGSGNGSNGERAGAGGRGDDALDNELAGAFDSMFGDAGASDPFAEATAEGASGADRLSTRFYSPEEMARVAAERMAMMQGDAPQVTSDTVVADFSELGIATPQGLGAIVEEGPDREDAPVDMLISGSEPEEEVEEQVWFAAIDDEQVGPLTLGELAEHWAEGDVDAESLVWRSGLDDWASIREIPELRQWMAQMRAGQGIGSDDIKTGGELDRLLGDALPDHGAPDPFATPDATGEMDVVDSTSQTWRPRGMTEFYQAASVVESSAQPTEAQEPDGFGEPEPSWQPGAAAALASLVEKEMRVADGPGGGTGIPSADDGDIELSDQAVAPFDVSATAPVPVPTASSPALDPFDQHLGVETGDDLDVAHIAGQSSMVLQRPSYIAEPPRERNWLLISALGFGAFALVVSLVMLFVIVFRGPPQVAMVQAPATSPAAPAADTPPVEPAAVAPAAENAPPAAAEPAATALATAAEPAPESPKPKVEERTTDSAKPAPQPREKKAKREPRPSPEPSREPAKAPEPAPEPAPVKTSRRGNCDPILYPDGNCPGGGGEPAAKASGGSKKTLSKTDVLMTVKKHMGEIAACASEQRKRNPRLATGQLKMQWYIRSDGRTKNVDIMTAKYRGTYVGECVTGSIRNWKFPAFEGDDVGPIKFPFGLD